MKRRLSVITMLILIMVSLLLPCTVLASSVKDANHKASLYDQLFVSVVDKIDNTITETVEIDGMTAVKASANKQGTSADQIMALDSYNINSSLPGINLDVYKYINVIYKYEGGLPSEDIRPAIYISSHDGEIKGGALPIFVSSEIFTNGWRSALYEIPDLTEKYVNKNITHNLNHIHINPYGRSIKVSELPDDATCYIQGVSFHTDKPETVGFAVPFIKGYDDGTFGTSKPLTRAQACSVAAEMLVVSDDESYEFTPVFDDVTEDAWYAKAVSFCYEKGVLNSFEESFQPEKNITRAEFADIFIKTVALMKNEITSKTLNGYNVNILHGSEKIITRAEAVYLIDLFLCNVETVFPDEAENLFPDVKKDCFAYNGIIRSAIPHAYVRYSGEEQNSILYMNPIKSTIDDELYDLGEAFLEEVKKLENVRINEIRSTPTEVAVSGKSYYFSAYGDDDNDGLSQDTPKKTIKELNSLILSPGDGVFFKRGETFRGNIITSEGVTYSAYGDGEKPLITASPGNFAGGSNWVETDTPNVWMLTTPILHDVGLVVFNSGECWSEKRIAGRDDFPEADLAALDKDLVMWHDVPTPINAEGYLYLRSDSGNPGNRFTSIELAPRNHIFKAVSDVTIDNICMKYTGAHAVSAGNVGNLTVQNCEFDFIGGSWFRTDTLSRYGNAVEIYGSCDGYTVDNCYIRHVYDAGVTHQYTKAPETDCIMKDIKYTNNLITETSYPVEYFINECNDDVTHIMQNVEISGNIILRTGYGFGDQRPDKKQAAHIKGWNTYNRAENFVIKNNIFGTSKYNLMQVGANIEEWLPSFDNNTYMQYAGESFGNIGLNASVGFDASILEYIINESGDQNAKVYYLKVPE